MMDWLHQLPVVWMALVIFTVIGVVTVLIYWTVFALGAKGYTRVKAVSPVMLTRSRWSSA